MDYLCQTISQLCILVCLCTLCEQLVPTDTLRGAIRMACGLMLLHIMLSQLFIWCAPFNTADATSEIGGWLTSSGGMMNR